MWFKLASANFSANNLGKMSDIAGSWGVSYSLQGNISKNNCPTSVKMNEGKTQAEADFTATFTLGSGATLTSITAKLKSSGAQLVQVTSGTSITVPANKITGDIEIIAIATGSSTGGGGNGDDSTTTPDTPTTGTVTELTFETSGFYNNSSQGGGITSPNASWYMSDLIPINTLTNGSSGYCTSMLQGHSKVAVV